MRCFAVLFLITVTLGQNSVMSQNPQPVFVPPGKNVSLQPTPDPVLPRSGKSRSQNTDPGFESVDPFSADTKLKEVKPLPEMAFDSSAPIWLLISPAGVRFLQTPDEVMKHQQSVPSDSFLVGCHEFSMNGVPGEQRPDFALVCKQTVLFGAYGTAKVLNATAGELKFETKSQSVQLSGQEEQPVKLMINDPNGDQMNVQAQKLIIQLSEESYQMSVSDAKFELSTEPVGNRDDAKSHQPVDDMFGPIRQGRNQSSSNPFGSL